VVGVGGEEEHHFLLTPNSMSVVSAVDLVIIHALIVSRLARFVLFSIFILLPPFLFIFRWIVQFHTIQRQIKRNGGSTLFLFNKDILLTNINLIL
jgi:hypothetical protein